MKEIPLSQGKVALVDDEDFEAVSKLNWCYHKRGKTEYAIANVSENGKRTTIELHRFIVRPPKTVQIDHRNGDGLNCQRYNMRLATFSQNQRNRKSLANNRIGLKGIHKHGQTYCVQIHTDFGRLRLGSLSLSEAVAVHTAMACEFHGEFANINR